MNTTRMLAAAAILSTLLASPVLARDMYNGRVVTQIEDMHYDRSDRGFWPADAAAGVVGSAIGSAGAIASAPFRGAYAYDDNYDGYDDGPRYSRSYAQRNGFVCMPGTWFRGENGRMQLCQ